MYIMLFDGPWNRLLFFDGDEPHAEMCADQYPECIYFFADISPISDFP